MVLSLILIVNKRTIYDKFLESLETQIDVDYEIICIDNYKNQYDSARKAYDDAARKASGKYLIFLHPDIRFGNPKALYDIVAYLEKLNDFGVVGVAGCPQELKKGKRVILSSMTHGVEQRRVGYLIKDIVEVQTVDECLFVVKRMGYDEV